MDTVTKDKVAGKALYLEFSDDEDYQKGYVYQHILLPDMIVEGRYYRQLVMRRLVSKKMPRSQWQFFYFNTSLLPSELRGRFGAGDYRSLVTSIRPDESRVFAKLDNDQVRDVAKFTISDFVKILRDIISTDWNIVGRPIAVEITAEELLMAASGDTPQGVIRRILRSREARNMPAMVNKKS